VDLSVSVFVTRMVISVKWVLVRFVCGIGLSETGVEGFIVAALVPAFNEARQGVAKCWEKWL